MGSRTPIGQMLLQMGYIDAWQLQSALGFQRKWGCRLGRALINLGLIQERVLMTELARQHGVRCVDLADLFVPAEVLRLVPEKVIRTHRVFPIALSTETRRGPLIVATSEPQNLIALDEVAFASGKAVTAALASELEIERCIERHFHGNTGPNGWGVPAWATGRVI